MEMNMEDFDLFEGLEDELAGVSLDQAPTDVKVEAEASVVEVVATESATVEAEAAPEPVAAVAETKPTTVAEAKVSDVELTEEETQAIEAQAAAESKPVDDVDSFFEQITEDTKKESTKKAPAKLDKPTTPKYTGPRTIKVYGQELWIETDNSVTLEDIRKRIVEDYQYKEFKADRTTMVMDEEGIVTAHVQFQKKG